MCSKSAPKSFKKVKTKEKNYFAFDQVKRTLFILGDLKIYLKKSISDFQFGECSLK